MRIVPVAVCAAVLAFAASGCKSPLVQVAEITSITAPDTVVAGAAFPVVCHAILGYHTAFVVDHIDTVRTASSYEIRIWSRDVSNGHMLLLLVAEGNWTFSACPTEPGAFRVVADQPDGSVIEKTVTVLP